MNLKKHAKNRFLLTLMLWLSIALLPVYGEENNNSLAYNQCLQNALISGDDNLTLGQIRSKCTQVSMEIKPLTARRINEVATENNPFVLTPHRLNYFIVSHYHNGINSEPFEQISGKQLSFRDQELQFQLSFKFPLYQDLHFLNKSLDFYAAYTNRSFWQFFDPEDSIPFRETNHEPEVWAEWETDFDFPFDFNLHKVVLGINHQSNGQTSTLSRGWNRVFLQGFLQHKSSYLSFKTWQRFNEADAYDNSFNYQKYLGDYELEAAYEWNKNTFAMTVRNRYSANQYGAVQLEYTYPISRRLKGYVQYFNGYGDSLIDMQHFSRKLGFGIVLADRI